MRHYLLLTITVGGAAVIGMAVLADRLGWSEAAQGWSVIGVVVLVGLIAAEMRDRALYPRR